jgi:hypothetical protein
MKRQEFLKNLNPYNTYEVSSYKNKNTTPLYEQYGIVPDILRVGNSLEKSLEKSPNRTINQHRINKANRIAQQLDSIIPKGNKDFVYRFFDTDEYSQPARSTSTDILDRTSNHYSKKFDNSRLNINNAIEERKKQRFLAPHKYKGLTPLSDTYNQIYGTKTELPSGLLESMRLDHATQNSKTQLFNNKVVGSPYLSTTKNLQNFINHNFKPYGSNYIRGTVDENMMPDVIQRAPAIGAFSTDSNKRLFEPVTMPPNWDRGKAFIPSLEQETLYNANKIPLVRNEHKIYDNPLHNQILFQKKWLPNQEKILEKLYSDHLRTYPNIGNNSPLTPEKTRSFIGWNNRDKGFNNLVNLVKDGRNDQRIIQQLKNYSKQIAGE